MSDEIRYAGGTYVRASKSNEPNKPGEYASAAISLRTGSIRHHCWMVADDARTIELAIAVAISFSALDAHAAYPERPVRYIVPSAVGGTPDIVGRLYAAELSKQMGQPFVVENRPGASGTIAMETLIRSTPDGYTIAHGVITQLSVNRSVLSKLSYDSDRDVVPVIYTSFTNNLLAVTLSLPAKSVQDLIDYARRNPGKLQYASAGNATTHHIAAELFKSMTGVDMIHIPYKGAGAAGAITDLSTGRVHLIFDNLPSILPQVKAGRVRGLAVTSAHRVAAVPELPTVAEAGVPGFETVAWGGTILPRGADKNLVLRLNAEFNRLLSLPDIKAKLNTLGAETVGGTPEAFTLHIRQETAKWAEVVKRAGIKAD